MVKKINCIIGGKIILEDEIINGKALIFDDKIIDIADEDVFFYKYERTAVNIIKAENMYVSPGFIDIHIHGDGGYDTMDAKLSALEAISATIAKSGVTAYLPTSMTMEKNKIYSALECIRQAAKQNIKGAKILGAHMEGPFISEKYCGAQNKNHIIKPEFKFVEPYFDIIKIITIAAEEDAEFEFIKNIKKSSNIILSIGHTNADYETTLNSINAGITNATHIFNAMPPLHHRDPGAIGAVLNSNISFELIADKIHIHPALFQILLNTKGYEKMILITDSIRAAYMQDGVWDLGGQQVTVKNGLARLKNGTLAGSTLKMNKAVLNILKNTTADIKKCVMTASLNPARLIGIDDKKGSIKIGKDADIVIFDEELNVQLTISEGREIYKR